MRRGAYHKAVRHLIGRPVEACSRYYGKLVWFGTWAVRFRPSNPLIAALDAAYRWHYPVVLSPDAVWLTIAQGLARHTRLNAQSLRDKFVTHVGQEELIVDRADLVPGSPENPWTEVLAEFSRRVRDRIGAERHELFVADFSTTTATTRAAMEVVLFDAMQPYFLYKTRMLCGIPQVILEGTPEDWHAMAERVARFTDLGLSWWVKPLRPVLLSIAESAAGRPDRDFWKAMVSTEEVCGREYVDGWVQLLFPYLKQDGDPASFRQSPPSVGGAGTDPQAFPNGYSEVSFQLQQGIEGPTRDMKFVGGLLGVAQDDDTLALRPEIGWAVCPDTPSVWL
jgi:hypothetical protein